ncbi:exported hypothetical protein [uncultured Stenotrophomonas sp.]|uniref:Uncharacterized protein n=1 Tax=uncultured Stenotrophomonas sp. TaxID=165438 RepID=A0A1Y5Q9J1_9GAMM|nr:exported hypothetical protein [uncultured Stenotrophomonas sp.]
MIKRLLVLALLPLSAQAGTDFARQWPLQLSQPDAGAYRVPLDASVHQAAHWRDLRDVRVLDADGKPVPSAVYAAATPLPARSICHYRACTGRSTAPATASPRRRRRCRGRCAGSRCNGSRCRRQRLPAATT